MRRHHAFRLAGGSRRIDDHGVIFRRKVSRWHVDVANIVQKLRQVCRAIIGLRRPHGDRSNAKGLLELRKHIQPLLIGEQQLRAAVR